jgi:hypothetical protein
MIKCLLFLAVTFGGLQHLRSADPANRVEALPGLARLESWRVAENSVDLIHADQWPDSLSLRFRSDEGQIARILLEKPLPIPDWATGLSFVMGNDGQQGRLAIQWLVQDVEGREFLFSTESAHMVGNTVSVSNPRQRRCPMKMTVPGLARPVLIQNIEPVVGRAQPQAPYQLIGLQMKGYDKEAGISANLYLRDFAFTRLAPALSGLYYALDGQECFGELDPVPNLAYGHLGIEGGGKVTVTWEALNRYDGQPFLVGGKELLSDPKDPYYPLLFNQRIEVPIDERGTYWIRVKSRLTKPGEATPSQISEREFRLDVLRGKEAKPQTIMGAGACGPNSSIQIAPQRSCLTYSEAEPFVVPILFWRPETPANTLSYRIKASSLTTAEILAKKEGALAGDSDQPTRVVCDLTDHRGGAYRIRAEILADGKVVDSLDRTVGKQGGKPPRIEHPDKGFSASEILSSTVPLTYLSPYVPEGPRENPMARRQLLEDFMDQAGTISDKIELVVLWKDIEPLPGVYDWAQLDKLLDYAREKKLSVLLWPSVVGYEPEWLPACFTQNKEGSVFGHNRYLFHRVRIDYWNAGPVRKAALDFLTALADRYKEHPAVHGYFFITEHPGEAAYVGWYDGYNPEAIENFRQFARQQWPGLEVLNKRWRTNFLSWEEVVPPTSESSLRFTLDWLAFRRDAIGDFLVDGARALRKADSHRVICIYIDGIDDKHVPQLLALGCFGANGGVQDPERGGIEYLGRAVKGLQERPEETTVTQWAGLFPTQLDASVFSMMLGGGANAHCKMYINTSKAFQELGPEPHSLLRFKKFVPIRTELRQTVRMPMDSYILDDRNGRLMTNRTTTWLGLLSGVNRNLFQSHLLCPAVPLEIATTGKLLFMMGSLVGTLEQSVMDGLARYVEQGGTLVMQVDAGRTCVETPERDWVLLRRFGFEPPTGKREDNRQVRAIPVAGDVFPPQAKPFVLGDLWPAPSDSAAKVLATFDGNPERAAITWRQHGKGRVVVIWASTLVPPTVAGPGNGYPFLKDLAQWAGVRIYSDANSPRLWTNLLKHKSAESFYGFVYNAVWQEKAETVEGVVRWFLPDGNYQISEMITGKPVGTRSAEQLRTEGIPVGLDPRNMEIYRMEIINSPVGK